MHRFIATLVTFVLLLSTTVFAGTPSPWAKSEIDKATAEGLITKKISANFQKPITREEFCELIVKFYEKTTGKKATSAKNIFKDTKNVEVLKAYNLGIVGGKTATTFAPNDNVTRQEICVMLIRALSLVKKDLPTDASHTFADARQISAWALPSVNILYAKGIMTGVGGNKFNPSGSSTCEQAVATVYRLYTDYKVGADKYEAELLKLVNDQRIKKGLKPLTIDYSVARAARAKSQDMSETRVTLSSVKYGQLNNLLVMFDSSPASSAMIIQGSIPTAKEAFEKWSKSTVDANCIFSTDFTQAGAGYAKSSNGKIYWTLIFVNNKSSVSSTQKLSIGDSAPDFSLKDTSGKVVKFSAYKGKVILLNFWASWAPTSAAELKDFQSFATSNKNIIVIGINKNETSSITKSFLKQNKITYPNLLDDGTHQSFVSYKYGAFDTSNTYLIDKNGKIKAIFNGTMNLEGIKTFAGQ